MNEKKVFSKKLALFLQDNGCKIIRTEVNLQKPDFVVYVFENTPQLQSIWVKYHRS